jgi:septin family protein
MRLIARSDEFELADPPPALEWYRGKLRENAYKVLVVGEAKRGKNTFVNALIGRDASKGRQLKPPIVSTVSISMNAAVGLRPRRYENVSKRKAESHHLARACSLLDNAS